MAFAPPLKTIANVMAINHAPSVSSYNLVLGTVHFTDLEHPSDLPIPSMQQTAVHQQAGGTRTVQTFGSQPGPITWKGMFYFTTAVDRVREMKRMEISGKPVMLTWGPFKWEVIVSKFEPTIHHQFEIAYDVTCEVVRDLTGQSTQAASKSVDSANQSLYDQIQVRYQALQFADTSTSAWSTALSAAGQSLSVASPLSNATPSALQQASQAVQNAMSLVQPYVTALEPLIGTSNLQRLFYAQGILSNLTMITSNLGTKATARSIQVIGGSLYAIASKFYSDPSLWTVIAAANGLTGAYLSNKKAITLKIPAKPAASPQSIASNVILANSSSITS